MKNRSNHKKMNFPARKFIVMLFLAVGIVFGAACSKAMAVVETNFLYSLSNFSGPVPFSWANIFFDEKTNEIYVVDSRKGDVRIFDKNGMEIYRFGDDGSLGIVVDVAVKEDGNILVLTKRHLSRVIILCNYRGEPLLDLELKNLPPSYSTIVPDRITYRQGQLYLMDSFSMKLIITDGDGLFLKGYDVGLLIGVEEKKRADTDIGGFSVDRQGNILFTVPVMFSAFSLSPDGEIQGFGTPGSAPGRFNIVGGIVADDSGYYYVADRLKCAILIFDRNFNFQKEFGYRGLKPGNLIGPKNLVLDSQGRLYVSQLRNRGISVFKVTH